ncbi:MAG: hypothetical protein N3A67_09915, partial [Ignavibacteria bacterium]|nr:hypothetical protein [Ignavibacteria bacterium]
EYDDYDRYVYSNILKRINNIKKIEQEGLRIYSNFSELLEDIFKSLYKFYPILIPEKMIKFDYLLNYDIVKYFLEDSNFNKLREFTKGSEINSIIGLEYISKDLLNILKQNLETLKEYKQNIDIINSFHGDDNENNNVDKIINKFEYEEAVKIYNEFRENFKKNILKSEKYN